MELSKKKIKELLLQLDELTKDINVTLNINNKLLVVDGIINVKQLKKLLFCLPEDWDVELKQKVVEYIQYPTPYTPIYPTYPTYPIYTPDTQPYMPGTQPFYIREGNTIIYDIS